MFLECLCEKKTQNISFGRVIYLFIFLMTLLFIEFSELIELYFHLTKGYEKHPTTKIGKIKNLGAAE